MRWRGVSMLFPVIVSGHLLFGWRGFEFWRQDFEKRQGGGAERRRIVENDEQNR